MRTDFSNLFGLIKVIFVDDVEVLTPSQWDEVLNRLNLSAASFAPFLERRGNSHAAVLRDLVTEAKRQDNRVNVLVVDSHSVSSDIVSILATGYAVSRTTSL